MKKIISILVFISYTLINGQGRPQDDIQIKSPQSYAFEKYGKIPVNLYTGTIDLKIPIVKIPTKNGDIDVFISYDSSGFLPHKKSDLAGVNWAMITGGKITRRVNGIPDEYKGQPTSAGSSPFGPGLELHGFLTGVRLAPYTSTQVYNLYSGAGSIGGNDWKLSSGVNGYEGEPDEFYFNGMGLIGKFMIGNDGVPKVESNDPNIIVDISGLSSYKSLGYCKPPVSTIVIKDGKGNKYYFGGEFPTYEISYEKGNSSGMSIAGYSGFTAINTFNLSKVEFADGNVLQFKYIKGTLNESLFCEMHAGQATLLQNSKLLSLENYLSDGTRTDSWVNCPGNMWDCTTQMFNTGTNSESFVLLKKSLLEEIRYNDYAIKINYLDTGYPIKHAGNANIYFNEFVIDNVELRNKDSILQKNVFLYEHYGLPQKRPFLKKIKELSSDKSYSFDYYNADSLPYYYTKGLDHWGYWNGNDSNISLAPLDTYNHLTGDYTLNNTFRDANTTKYNVGLLSKVVYPTKGYTVFEYEPQSYGKRIERNSFSQFLPILTTNSGIGGGARIHKKSDYTENNIVENETEYKYLNTLGDTKSSGILMNWPRYLYYFEFQGPSEIQKLMIKNSSNVQSNSFDSYNIGYPIVFEILKNKGYIKHEYTSYESHPDRIFPDAHNIKDYVSNGYTNVPENLYKNFKNLYGIDYSTLRGLPQKKSYYAENSVSPLKIEEWQYNDNLSDYNPNTILDNENYVSIQHLSGAWVQGYRKYLNTSKVKKKITTDFLANGSVLDITEYYYDSNNHMNLTREHNLSSDNTVRFRYLSYAKDINNNFLITKNMTGVPLIIEEKNNDKRISKTEIIYPSSQLEADTKTSGLVLPYTVLSTDLQNTVSTEVTYDKYDSKGNLQQYTTKDGLSTVIIWGYNQTQPIAKIEGAKLTDMQQSLIDSIVNASNTDAAAAANNDETSLLSVFNTFRNSLPNYQITTYTYDPLIGVRSITPPSGIRESYVYDSANRLQKVIDVNGKVLKEMKYNYKN